MSHGFTCHGAKDEGIFASSSLSVCGSDEKRVVRAFSMKVASVG